jgi:hypothetical protein
VLPNGGPEAVEEAFISGTQPSDLKPDPLAQRQP